jgi:hypothetical protein
MEVKLCYYLPISYIRYKTKCHYSLLELLLKVSGVVYERISPFRVDKRLFLQRQ